MLSARDVVLSTRTDDHGMVHMTLTHKPTGAAVSGHGIHYEDVREGLQKTLELAVEHAEAAVEKAMEALPQ